MTGSKQEVLKKLVKYFTPPVVIRNKKNLCVCVYFLVLNQLPLPSPLPATTTKSLLYNGRIAEEVSCLLSRRDDTLVSQLAHSLNQVSTEHMWVSHLGLLPSVHPH